MVDPRSASVPEAEIDALRAKLMQYASRYHISGPEKDRLVERTLRALADDPDILFQKPIEQVIAETMHHLFMHRRDPSKV